MDRSQIDEELERLSKQFAPDKWKGDEREIESAFGDLELRLTKSHQAERKAFAEGYEHRAIDEATREPIARLRSNTGYVSDNKKWANQEAINQLRDGARRDLATNQEYQRSFDQALSELTEQQAEVMQHVHDREGDLLNANGFVNARATENDPLLRMAEIFAETRNDLERVEELDRTGQLEKATEAVTTAKAEIESERSEERPLVFFEDRKQDRERGRGY